MFEDAGKCHFYFVALKNNLLEYDYKKSLRETPVRVRSIMCAEVRHARRANTNKTRFPNGTGSNVGELL